MQSSDAGRFAWRSALGFLAVVLGALALALTVRSTGSPVVQLDRAVAGDLNAAVAPHPAIVTVLQVLTSPGDPITSWVVLSVLTAALLIRRRLRLALYVAVTGLGVATLSPLLKDVVDRLRPVVGMPVATAGGPSFPSGHALAATVWVGVVLLVLLPVVPARLRRLAVALGVLAVVVVGLTRLALGVHFVSDVIGGWLIGGAWLLVTATAFREWRRRDGLAVPRAVDGLDPHAARDLTPSPLPERALAHPWTTTVAQLFVVAVLLLGALVGVGTVLVRLGPGSALVRADVGVVTWLADNRVPALDTITGPLAELGNTGVIVGAGVVAAALAYLATRRLRPPLVIVAALTGEVLIFLASSSVVGRPRPPVAHLDAQLPPTSSFPSGHTAAALCLYGAVAALVWCSTRRWWRWAVLATAVAVVAAVAFARLYRGAHHPTDVLASMAFGVVWLLAVLRLVGDVRPARSRPPAATEPPAAAAVTR